MVDANKTLKLVVAGVALAGAVGLVVWQLTARSGERTVEARWVCDHCGAEAQQPFGSESPDCPHCAEGQLVQRVFFKCRKCGSVFEGYQLNRSPKAARAADARAQANARDDRKSPDETMLKILVRRPGGPWAWTGSVAARDIMRRLRCPQCGEGPPSQFVKQLKGE